MKLYTDEELAQLLDQDIFHQISEAADRLGLVEVASLWLRN